MVFQVLSEGFIEKHIDKIDMGLISKYQKLSSECIERHNPSILETCWLYKSAEFLKRKVEELNLYECYEDHFIAFKGIRSNRQSKHNFHYQYLEGETYKSNCDCNVDAENSFGLSAWLENIVQKWLSRLKLDMKMLGRLCMTMERLDVGN